MKLKPTLLKKLTFKHLKVYIFLKSTSLTRFTDNKRYKLVSGFLFGFGLGFLFPVCVCLLVFSDKLDENSCLLFDYLGYRQLYHINQYFATFSIWL